MFVAIVEEVVPVTDGRSWFVAGLFFVGLGAAVFTGSGVAVADTEASDSAGSSNSSAGNESSASLGESRVQRVGTGEESDTSNDPETVPSFTLRRAANDVAADDVAADDVAADDVAADDVAADDVAADEDVVSDDGAASAEAMAASSGRVDSAAVSMVEPVAQRTSASTAEVLGSSEAIETTSAVDNRAVEPAVDDGAAVVVAVDDPGVSATCWCSRMRSTNFALGLINATPAASCGRLAAITPAYPPLITTTLVLRLAVFSVMVFLFLSDMPLRQR
jgi:hypothetical protein